MKRYVILLLILSLLLVPGCRKKVEESCTAHLDSDANLMCDECGSTVLIYLDFYNQQKYICDPGLGKDWIRDNFKSVMHERTKL